MSLKTTIGIFKTLNYIKTVFLVDHSYLEIVLKIGYGT